MGTYTGDLPNAVDVYNTDTCIVFRLVVKGIEETVTEVKIYARDHIIGFNKMSVTDNNYVYYNVYISTGFSFGFKVDTARHLKVDHELTTATGNYKHE